MDAIEVTVTRKCSWGLLFLLTFPFGAQAANFNFVAGPSITSGDRATIAAFGSVFGDSATGRFHLEPVATVGWIRAHHTTRENLDHSVWAFGAGVRVLSPSGHWFGGVQLARTTVRTDALSSRWEFIDSAGWQAGRFTLMLRHMSDGHIVGGSPNLGETMLLGGVRF